MIRFIFLILFFISYSFSEGIVLPLKLPTNLKLYIPKNESTLPLLPPPSLVSSLDSMSLNDFVRYASKSLHKNILVSGTLNGTIDFVSNKTISNNEINSILRSALELNGYSLVSKSNYLMVVPSSDLPKYFNSGMGSFNTKVFKIDYSDVLPMLESVKSLLSSSGSAFGVAESKSLVVSDRPENIEKITRLVNALDRKPKPKHNSSLSYRLVNSSSVSVAQTLRGIFGKSLEGNVSSSTVSDIVISVNEPSNTIFINGDEDSLKRIPDIIKELDREQYQVYIQVRIVEINNDLSTKIGLKYGLEGGISSGSNFLTFASNMGGSSVVSESIFSSLSGTLGNVKQVLHIGAALDLLKAQGVSRTVSNPSVLCLNNKESKVIVGRTLSFSQGSTTGSAGTTNSLSRNDVGLNLTIKPLVASKDKLSLSIDAILENVLPTLDSNNQPMTTKQQIKTDSILHHGETIVLGGFVKDYDSNIKTAVPFLSDLPYLGDFFKHTAVNKTSDNLLLVITPYIVDDSMTLSKLQSDLGALGNLQKTFNEGIK